MAFNKKLILEQMFEIQTKYYDLKKIGQPKNRINNRYYYLK